MTTATQVDVTVPVVDVDPYSDGFLTAPELYHERLREAGPVVWIPKYEVFATARHAEVRTVLRDHETYISSAGVGVANFNHETPFRPKSLLLEADPPAHTKVRTIVSRVLSPDAVAELRPAFQAEADALLDRVVGTARRDGQVDVVKELAEVYPLKVFPDAVGLDPDGRENLQIYGNMIFNAFGPRNERFLRSAAGVRPVTEWVMHHCQRARLKPGGFGELIYRAADAGEITHDEAAMLVRSFLSAGIDTTVAALGNALFCFAQHPDQYAKLRANPSLSRNAFEEVLRYVSPVQTMFRTTSRDTTLGGVPIPNDTKVMTFLAAANRDPRQWTDPDRFDIERRAGGHMAFGFGIHGCVGQFVARLEGELILEGVARRVARIEIAGTPIPRPNNTVRALASLPLALLEH
jgi:cytochrome P450